MVKIQLIGMLDSPYVRRVAVSLRLLGIAFEHRPVSVFRQFDEFARINPVVKAPTLVCGDGTVLMDSSLILDHLEAIAPGPLPRRLLPAEPAAQRRALRRLGLALAACEKSVQIVYEHELRPQAKRHAPWLARIEGQLAVAYATLEADLASSPLAATLESIDQAGITCAVAWSFTQALLPGRLAPADHPGLQAHTEAAEALPVFRALPMFG